MADFFFFKLGNLVSVIPNFPGSLSYSLEYRTAQLHHDSHLDEREGVVFLHETLDAVADLLQTNLVLADPGNVLLDHGPTDVPVSVTTLLQPADVPVHFGPDVIAQYSQAVLTVVHTFLGRDGRMKKSKKRQQI